MKPLRKIEQSRHNPDNSILNQTKLQEENARAEARRREIVIGINKGVIINTFNQLDTCGKLYIAAMIRNTLEK